MNTKLQYPNLLAGCEEPVPRLLRRAEYCAKRMECAQLAAAFVSAPEFDSGSKLHNLHALRAIRLRLCFSAFIASLRFKLAFRNFRKPRNL
jgi:hypothetical protein